jgi:hypothetical protein
MITQNQLRVCLQLREAGRQYEALRREVVALLENGSRIEPGSLTTFLQESSSQRLSWRVLEQLWGSGAVGGLRLQIPFSISQQLIIEPAPLWIPLNSEAAQPSLIRSPNFNDECRD